MDYGSRNVMYRLKPVFKSNTCFSSSSSMYKSKNLPRRVILTPYKTEASCAGMCVVDDKEIVARQETLLSSLYRLRKDVSKFEEILKELKISPKTSGFHRGDSLNRKEIHNFVINCDPSHPPFGLLWLQKLCKVPINITIHLHSSLSKRPLPKYIAVFDQLKNDTVNREYPRMTLIWKKVGEDVQLILSPFKNTALLGEMSVLRFLNYVLDCKKKSSHDIQTNELLDLAQRLNCIPGKDQQLLLTQVQKFIKNGNWINGSNPTIADAAVWSALIRLKESSLPPSLYNYLTSCSKFINANTSLLYLK